MHLIFFTVIIPDNFASKTGMTNATRLARKITMVTAPLAGSFCADSRNETL
jgi:hypothetical protein